MTTLLAVVLVITLLYVAREVLIPLALAVLLTFLLAPLCDRLERWKIGRIASVLIVTAMSFMVLGAIGWIAAGQIIELASQIPKYQHNIREKIQAIEFPGAGPISRATESIKELTQEVLAAPPSGDPSQPRPENAMPVQVVDKPLQPMDAIVDAIDPFWDPLVNAGIVIVFVIFMLLQRDDLRDRILRLIGQGRLTVATQAIDDAARRVSRYLQMQLIVNATYGLAAGVGMLLIGVPNAILWGVSATLLRFIPYIGPWLGAMLPIALAMAAFDSWNPVLLTVALFFVIEIVSNNVMEPWLYGSRTGISPVAILASAVFWTWLWGPVGLVLATPLTVCVVVMGQYIPRLEFLSVLFSDEPGLSPAARLYQRLLAMDQDDVYEIAETYLAETSLLQLYDDVLLPALQLAERDRHHERLDADHEQAVYDVMRELVNELGDRPAPPAKDEETMDPASAKSAVPQKPPVTITRALCVPAQDVADELSCLMLAQVLKQEAIDARVVSTDKQLSELMGHLDKEKTDVVCVCAVPPQGITRLRLLCKRLLKEQPELKLIVGFWSISDLTAARERVKACQPERVVASLADAVGLLRG